MNEDFITWQAPEFEFREKNSDWYWVLGIVAIAGSIIALLLQNILLVILIILGAFTVGIYANRQPRTISFIVSSKGIQIDTTLYPYSSFASFWIDETREFPVLRLTPNKTVALPLAISLEHTDHTEVQNFMENYLQEIEQGESVVDRTMDLTNF